MRLSIPQESRSPVARGNAARCSDLVFSTSLPPSYGVEVCGVTADGRYGYRLDATTARVAREHSPTQPVREIRGFFPSLFLSHVCGDAPKAARRERDGKTVPACDSPLCPAGRFARSGGFDSVMILPQVHLRKPCYDFYFL